MKEKKIYVALESLGIYELNSFYKFLQSPFFNQNQTLVEYFEFLLKKIKSKTSLHEISSQEIWDILFVNSDYKDVKLRKLNSDLYSQFELYLAHKELDTNKQLANNLKLKAIKSRGIESLYPSIIREIEQTKKIDPNRHAEYYLNQFNIEKSIFDLKTEFEKKNLGKNFESEIDVNNISENLDIFYIAEKLKYYCRFLLWRQMYKIETSIKGIEIILKLAQNPIFQEVPVIAIYYRISQISIDPSALSAYYELKELSETKLYLFPDNEAKEIIFAMLSFCINKVNKGNLDFQIETLDIYKTALPSKLLLIDGYMSPTTYRNIVFFGLRVGQFEWVELFIYDYANQLNPKYKTNALHFSLARLETYRKNYQEVIQHINRVSFDDLWYDLNSRSLLLTAYYELEEHDALESLLQSFRVYISREKSLPKNRKTHYLNLIKFSKKLLYLPKDDRTKRKNLRDEIESTKGVVNKPWLLSKLEEV